MRFLILSVRFLGFLFYKYYFLQTIPHNLLPNQKFFQNFLLIF
nr:MAG TPA: hypothetical protein [Caudoviricetes sp.]